MDVRQMRSYFNDRRRGWGDDNRLRGDVIKRGRFFWWWHGLRGGILCALSRGGRGFASLRNWQCIYMTLQFLFDNAGACWALILIDLDHLRDKRLQSGGTRQLQRSKTKGTIGRIIAAEQVMQ